MTEMWNNKQNYGFLETGNGTSYAVPIVAAALARLVNEYGLSIDQAIDSLFNTAEITLFKNKKTLSGNVLNFKNAVMHLPQEPTESEKEFILKEWKNKQHDPLKFEEEFEDFSHDPAIYKFRANDVYKIITAKYPRKKVEMSNEEKQHILLEWLSWSEGQDITTTNSAQMIHDFATGYLKKDIEDKPAITRIVKDYIQKILLLKEMNKKP